MKNENQIGKRMHLNFVKILRILCVECLHAHVKVNLVSMRVKVVKQHAECLVEFVLSEYFKVYILTKSGNAATYKIKRIVAIAVVFFEIE